MNTKSPATGPTIQKVRPHWGAVLTAVLIFLLLIHPAGVGLAAIAALLELMLTGMWQAVTLLGYIAGALTPDEDDEDE